MIGWIISKTAPQKEWKHLHDIIHISENEPIPAYIPVHLFYRNLSRYAQARKPVRELIAPRLVFVQAGYRKIAMIRDLRTCEGIVLDNDLAPYVIDPESMVGFMAAVERSNEMVERMEQEALGRIGEAKKTTWLKMGEDIHARLLALVGVTPRR